MSLQQIKAKLLAVGILALSASGTFALFGSVPVVAKIAANPPFSIDKIEAFLIQQADFSAEPETVRQSLKNKANGKSLSNIEPTANSDR